VDYVVLDTDVASLILKHRLTGRVAGWLLDRTLVVTFVTVGELTKWADLRGWGPRKWAVLDAWLRSAYVLEYDRSVARTWGRLVAAGQRRGRSPQVNDTWIAACCLVGGLPLATHNVKDLRRLR
jgi:predicted nucleic acid-binding protein